MARVPSVMENRFSQVPRADIPRSSFNRSCGLKTTFDAGLLVPVLVDEVLPGDTFSCRMTAFARLATPLKPVMDNMFLDSFFFFVPSRLVWDNWQRFNGEQDDPDDSTDFLVPQTEFFGMSAADAGTLIDYFGMPVGNVSFPREIQVNALPFRAYNLIWNEWFRDQNLQDSLPVPKDDGPDPMSAYQVRRRGKRHDYFTSALPWPQKGPAVQLPIGSLAPVRGIGFSEYVLGNGPITVGETPADPAGPRDNVVYPDDKWMRFSSVDQANGIVGRVEWDGAGPPPTNLRPQIYADLSDATASTINELRQAFQVQKLLERDARGGTRYIEILKSHFGVTSPDARLQRPEYLGGGSTPINITPVPQTTPDPGESTPQGNLAAFGTASVNRHGFSKSFVEHGYIIGLVSVRADLTYQQGLDRMWSRSTRYDFYWPALSHIGEQAVLNKEIFCSGNPEDEDVFGYQERYAEYRYKPSMVTGLFRSNVTGSLDIWHLAQDFQSLPGLSDTFIQDNPPIDRVIAVQSEPHFLFDSYFAMRCARPMPVYSVPGLIDHF